MELGWPGIAVAEAHGGQGLGAVELAVLLEELGYACAATPFLSTAVVAAVIQACGSGGQRERHLPALVSGDATAGLGTRELCADGVGAAVLVLLDGDEAELVEGAEAEPLDVDRLDPALCQRRVAAAASRSAPVPPRVRAARGGRGRRRLPAGARHDARLRQGA